MGEKRLLVDSSGSRWSRGCAENQGREAPRNSMAQEALEADQSVEVGYVQSSIGLRWTMARRMSLVVRMPSG